MEVPVDILVLLEHVALADHIKFLDPAAWEGREVELLTTQQQQQTLRRKRYVRLGHYANG